MLYLSPAITAYCCLLALLLGTCMGSFLNCMASRRVHGQSALRGRSHCDACGHTLAPRDLIPVLSYLLSRGRCRYCGAKLSPRHLWAEVCTALTFLLLLLRYDISLQMLQALLLACVLLATLIVTGTAARSERVVNVCSWGEYIDESLITEFEEQTGIRVNYQTAESNEALYSLIKMGGADFDVIVPSDYMIARLIQEDMLAELNYDHIPNFQKIDPQFTHLSYDPENKYTVPYTWGSVGIIYNTAMVSEPITSWSAMFDEQYAGQVLMINNSRDALMAALCCLTEAFELVKNAKDKGVYQAFVMDEIFGKMEGGNAAIAMYYAGDYLTMLENNEDLAFVIPEEGSNWFVDAMCVLKSSQHMDEAEEWINFIASTDANLANMDYIWYASPNAEALAEYPAYYQETYGEPLDEDIYHIMAIPDEERARCEIYVNLPRETLKFYDKLWTQLGV